jgi:Zn-dependent protease
MFDLFDPDLLIQRLFILIPLWLSLGVHEWAHAWSAFKLGDDTAKLQGRMSLNPLVHIDPVGTLLLPLLGVPFGWAKPVPVQPLRFRRSVNMRTGMMIVAAAGPISNVCLAILSFAALGAIYALNVERTLPINGGIQLLRTMVLFNVILAIFNLLPIPPLDGSRIVEALVPNQLRKAWYAFCRIGPLLLMAVILTLVFMRYGLFDGISSWVSGLIEQLRSVFR